MPRETGRRRQNVDDDDSSSEEEQTINTTTTVQQPPAAAAPEPVSAPVAPARARAKAPAAAVVKPPTLPAHADPANGAAAAAATDSVPAAAKESGDEEDEDDAEDEEEEEAVKAPVLTAAQDAAHKEIASEVEALDYDTLTYAALLALMKKATRPVLEELMAQREQQVETNIQQQQNQRVERFLDVAASPTAAAADAADEDAVEGYRYNTMLTRLFDALNRNNEGSAMTERNQLPVPILERMGKKKTVIANFGRICEAFHRPMEDVKDFIEKELSIRGNLDSNNALILKFEIRKQTDFDRVLIKYLDEYVKCNLCHRIDTTLTKDGRRLELRCNVCTATRTVTAAGSATFSAQIEKRSRQRAAMTL